MYPATRKNPLSYKQTQDRILILAETVHFFMEILEIGDFGIILNSYIFLYDNLQYCYSRHRHIRVKIKNQ